MNFERLTTYLDELQERYGVPGSDLLVTKNQEEIYRHLTGYRDYEHKEATKENQLYRLFSATKVITMIAVMQQIERERSDFTTNCKNFYRNTALCMW